MNVLTSVAPRTVQDREVAALITIQTLTSSPAIRQGGVMLSHLGEHALVWTVLLLSVPVMMASRFILGVHYPSDVLTGSLLGAVMGHWVARAGRP